MTFRDAHQQFIRLLQPEIEEREAKSMARIIFEDVFHHFGPPGQALITPQQFNSLKEIAVRLKKLEPLQYILGEADFFGLKFKVKPDVLIPRPETEELVHWILELGKEEKWEDGLDIGTGSGCIPVVLKYKRPDWQLSGWDISQDALKIAEENAEKNEVKVAWKRVDILDEKAWQTCGHFDFIVSNPPYIPNSEKQLMPAHVLDYEPALALFVEDKDPLLFYRKIGQFALQHLKPKGCLFFELNEFNAEKVAEMLCQQGFKQTQLQRDMQGKNRMLRCRK